MKILTGLITVFVSASAIANDDLQLIRSGETYWTFELGYNQGKRILGSEDARYGTALQINFLRPEPRFTHRNNHAQAVYGLYFLESRSPVSTTVPTFAVQTYGFRFGGRYWNEWIPGVNTYLDLGWGFSYTNRTTIDLPIKLNSVPYIGIGFTAEYLNIQYFFSIRWHHMSNGGTYGSNQGFNAFQYSIGVRF